MDAALATLDLTTLQGYLAEALTARHQLAMGAQHASIGSDTIGGHDSATYTQANMQELAAYITQLQQAITDKSGGTRRGPIHIAPYG